MFGELKRRSQWRETKKENDKVQWGIRIQLGSEVQKCPDFEWSKRGWVENGLDFEWDLKSGSLTF